MAQMVPLDGWMEQQGADSAAQRADGVAGRRGRCSTRGWDGRAQIALLNGQMEQQGAEDAVRHVDGWDSTGRRGRCPTGGCGMSGTTRRYVLATRTHCMNICLLGCNRTLLFGLQRLFPHKRKPPTPKACPSRSAALCCRMAVKLGRKLPTPSSRTSPGTWGR